MTLKLELPPETEARLREIARAQNLAVEEATVQTLEQWMRQQFVTAAEESKTRGSMKGTGLSSDDFLRAKHQEAQRELEKDQARWRDNAARQRQQSP